MSTMKLNQPVHTVSLRQLARIAGVLYIVIIAAGMFAGLTRESMFVSGDPAATAENVIAAEGLFRATIMADLIMVLADVAIGVTFFYLLKPVNQGLSLLAAAFRLAQATGLGVNLLMLLIVLQFVNGDVTAPGTETTQTQAYVFFNAHALGYNLALMFFAASLLIQGYLVFVSGYFPRWLGVLLIVAAGGYLIDNSASFILSDYADYADTFQMIVMVAFPVELIMALYLLSPGVRPKSDSVAITIKPAYAGTPTQ